MDTRGTHNNNNAHDIHNMNIQGEPKKRAEVKEEGTYSSLRVRALFCSSLATNIQHGCLIRRRINILSISHVVSDHKEVRSIKERESDTVYDMQCKYTSTTS